MRKPISIFLALVMAVSVFSAGFTTVNAASTTVNGKTAVKGGYVTVSYTLKAPEKMDDIQATVHYSKGLKLTATSYNNKMKTGSFIHNEKLPYEIRFNCLCPMNRPMDLRNKTTLITMKFKVTAAGKHTTSFDLQCLDGASNKQYGKNQNKNNYKKLSIGRVERFYVYSIRLNKTSLKLKKGKSYRLKAAITPSTASKSVRWTTSNKKVATVNSKGKIKAKKKGICYITCTARDGSRKYTRCKVRVKKR